MKGDKIPRKPKQFYHKFHDKIKDLLDDAGFAIERSDYYKKGANIFCSAEGHHVIFQCRSTKRKNVLYKGLDSLIDEYARKVKKEKARVAILALKNYRVPPEYQEKKEDLLKDDKIIIWDNKEIEYFKRLVDSLGKWSKYPLLGDFGVTDEFAHPIPVPCMKVRQDGTEFGIFTIPPETLLKIADVFRRIRDPKAYQRMVTEKRVKEEIKEFLEGPRPLFPTNVVCVFRDGATYHGTTGELTIPMKYSSVWIIDGQHRLYAFCHLVDPTKRRYFNLICAGFNISGMDNSFLEISDQAEMFATINEKAKRVPKELLIDILLKTGKADRKMKVADELKKTKVFENKIKSIDTVGKIHIATFVTVSMRKLVGDETIVGILSKWYGRQRQLKIIPSQKEEDFVKYCTQKLKMYFSTVKKKYGNIWGDSKNYILATDRGIRALLRIAEWILEYSNGLKDKTKAENTLGALRDFDFRSEKLKRMYLGEGGADKLADLWIGMIQDSYPDFGPRPTLKEAKITHKQGNRAKKIIRETLSKFDGEVIGELMNIDPTTFRYLSFIPQYCSVKIFFHGVEKKTWEKCGEQIKKLPHKSIELREIRCLDGKRFIHERWLADGKNKIDFGIDLKDKPVKWGGYTITLSDKPRITERYRMFQKIWATPIRELPQKFGARIERRRRK